MSKIIQTLLLGSVDPAWDCSRSRWVIWIGQSRSSKTRTRPIRRADITTASDVAFTASVKEHGQFIISTQLKKDKINVDEVEDSSCGPLSSQTGKTKRQFLLSLAPLSNFQPHSFLSPTIRSVRSLTYDIISLCFYRLSRGLGFYRKWKSRLPNYALMSLIKSLPFVSFWVCGIQLSQLPLVLLILLLL